MAYIKRLKDDQLVGGSSTDDVYPVTTTQAIYSQSSSGETRKKSGAPEKLEDRLKDHEDDAVELHSKTELFSASLSASPATTSFELTSARTVITLNPSTSIKTYGDYGDRPTTVAAGDKELVVTDTTSQGDTFEPATLVDNDNNTYSWTLANKTGQQTATFTATKNGYTRVATRSASLYLRKYFAFMSTQPSSVEDFITLVNAEKGVSEYSTGVVCTVTVPPNETGLKHIYLALPDNWSLNNYTVIQTSSQLEFKMIYVGTITRTINSKSLVYKLYESEATPDSSNSKELQIKSK